MTERFKDCFSKVAKGYAKFRPTYPAALFEWLATLPARRRLAWDCACGSGQATTGLAACFDRVIATDASQAQIDSAPKTLANVEWRVAPAHESGLPEAGIDLVTVAQALHWFDPEAFYREVYRVLREDGVIAVWTYGINQVEGTAVNDLVQDFYSNVVGPYWPPERHLIESKYATLPFPFSEFSVPAFQMLAAWNLDQLLGYFRTWSATNRYIAANGHDPVDALAQQLTPIWGQPQQTRTITWPLTVKAGALLPS